MEVRVKVVFSPISFRVISRKLMVWYRQAQAWMISSLREWVRSADPLGMVHPPLSRPGSGRW